MLTLENTFKLGNHVPTKYNSLQEHHVHYGELMSKHGNHVPTERKSSQEHLARYEAHQY